jgi:hypothetical protein
VKLIRKTHCKRGPERLVNPRSAESLRRSVCSQVQYRSATRDRLPSKSRAAL